MKPGDKIPVKDLDVTVLTAGGDGLDGSAAGRRPAESRVRQRQAHGSRILPRTRDPSAS